MARVFQEISTESQ